MWVLNSPLFSLRTIITNVIILLNGALCMRYSDEGLAERSAPRWWWRPISVTIYTVALASLCYRLGIKTNGLSYDQPNCRRVINWNNSDDNKYQFIGKRINFIHKILFKFSDIAIRKLLLYLYFTCKLCECHPMIGINFNEQLLPFPIVQTWKIKTHHDKTSMNTGIISL